MTRRGQLTGMSDGGIEWWIKSILRLIALNWKWPKKASWPMVWTVGREYILLGNQPKNLSHIVNISNDIIYQYGIIEHSWSHASPTKNITKRPWHGPEPKPDRNNQTKGRKSNLVMVTC